MDFVVYRLKRDRATFIVTDKTHSKELTPMAGGARCRPNGFGGLVGMTFGKVRKAGKNRGGRDWD